MAKSSAPATTPPRLLRLLLILLWFAASPPIASASRLVAKDGGTPCTMCASCDNPCQPINYPSPSPPQPPATPQCPPPPSSPGSTFYYYSHPPSNAWEAATTPTLRRRPESTGAASFYPRSSFSSVKMKESSDISRLPTHPQQNGVVERRNRAVMAMARSLLKGTHTPTKFWGEAVRHVVYLLNRLPTKALGEHTPFEAWMGRKSHLAHLSSPMVYLGVEEGCKAHRLFDPRHGKLQVSRDVMFRENCEWTWNAGANNEEKVPEFMVVDAFDTDEVIIAANIEGTAEDVTTPAVAVVPMTGVSSPSTPSSNTHTTSSPSITNSPESYEGPVRFRSIADIYVNTEEVVGIDEEEGEVMMVISEEPTCYQEATTEACWYEAMEKELKSIEMNNT
ncbi:hypothetical protein ZIOFF_022070 [Zingiber officinale]|uniref:Integrase catalytic domain-containing protein n=1 Tax=Zingiber officinale TaxID=94328 RepID=A0A8J5HJM0_ZINOF|nr:hypothetical protein ZIOFF_022070 [Zingiber officinale]